MGGTISSAGRASRTNLSCGETAILEQQEPMGKIFSGFLGLLNAAASLRICQPIRTVSGPIPRIVSRLPARPPHRLQQT